MQINSEKKALKAEKKALREKLKRENFLKQEEKRRIRYAKEDVIKEKVYQDIVGAIYKYNSTKDDDEMITIEVKEEEECFTHKPYEMVYVHSNPNYSSFFEFNFRRDLSYMEESQLRALLKLIKKWVY